MKIVIVTQEDPFYIPIFLKEFFKIYNKSNREIQIEGVMIQEALGTGSIFSLAKRMYNFYGLRDFVKQSYKYAISKIKNVLFRFNLLDKNFSVEYFVKDNNINLLPYSDANSNQFNKFIKSENIDLIVSVSASQIFNKEILNTPKYGCINLHNAPLPKYRGMLPNFWQMYHDEDYSVLTIHKMVEKLDQGQIIYQKKTKIESWMALDDLIKVTKTNSAQALWKVLKDFKEDNIEYKEMPDIEGSYFSFPNKEDVKEFKEKGKKLL
jgi:methionyl-tRNA formyltransferase